MRQQAPPAGRGVLRHIACLRPHGCIELVNHLKRKFGECGGQRPAQGCAVGGIAEQKPLNLRPPPEDLTDSKGQPLSFNDFAFQTAGHLVERESLHDGEATFGTSGVYGEEDQETYHLASQGPP